MTFCPEAIFPGSASQQAVPLKEERAKVYLPKRLVGQVSLRPESGPRSAGLAPSGWKWGQALGAFGWGDPR